MLIKEQVLEALTHFPHVFSVDELIRKLTPLEQAWHDEWHAVAARFKLGTEVSGQVIHKAPFGDFIEIGASEPALLKIVDMPALTPEKFELGLYNPLGSTVRAWVLGLYSNRSKQLQLTQNPSIDFEALAGRIS